MCVRACICLCETLPVMMIDMICVERDHGTRQLSAITGPSSLLLLRCRFSAVIMYEHSISACPKGARSSNFSGGGVAVLAEDRGGKRCVFSRASK